MNVRTTITSELAVAIGRIGAAHPDCGIQIMGRDYRDGEPEQTWHVHAIDGEGGLRRQRQHLPREPGRGRQPRHRQALPSPLVIAHLAGNMTADTMVRAGGGHPEYVDAVPS